MEPSRKRGSKAAATEERSALEAACTARQKGGMTGSCVPFARELAGVGGHCTGDGMVASVGCRQRSSGDGFV